MTACSIKINPYLFYFVYRSPHVDLPYLDASRDLHILCFGNKFSGVNWKSYFAGYYSLLLFYDTKLIARLDVSKKDENGLRGLWNLCVHPNWRGKGIAVLLIHQVQSWCECPLFLYVETSNVAAQCLYLKTGFAPEVNGSTLYAQDIYMVWKCKNSNKKSEYSITHMI